MNDELQFKSTSVHLSSVNTQILVAAQENLTASNIYPAEENGAMTLLHSSSVVSDLDLYLSGYILLPICLLGIICNILVAIVLTRKSMRSSTNSFLLALAIFDSVLLVCTVFMVCLSPLSIVYNHHIFPQILPYVYPLGLTAQTCTIWVTVAFTVERYIAVRYPLKASSMCTVKRARIICCVVFILSILYNLSRWFEYRCAAGPETNTTSRYIPGTKLQAYMVQPTNLGSNPTYETIYFSAFYLPVMCIIPILLLSILNTFLIRAVHKSNKERQAMGSARASKENNVTIMLVSVVIVFIACQVPALIYNMAYGVAKSSVVGNTSWQMFSIIRNFTVTVNSAVNFILYCAFGQKFRRVFLKLFCKQWLQAIIENGTVNSNVSSVNFRSFKLTVTGNSKKTNNNTYSKTLYTAVDGQSEMTELEVNGDTVM